MLTQSTASGLLATRASARSIGRGLAGLLLLAWVQGCPAPSQTQPRIEPTADGASHSPLSELLARYQAADGRVDYAAWKAQPADVAALDAYVEALRSAPPELTPQRYASDSDRLAYWLNLYNGLAVREILRRWPIDTLEDAEGALPEYGGFGRGILYDTRFTVGSRALSLLDIETLIMRAQYRDARVHFALNCGTLSCPILPRTPFDSATLERRLDQATREFVNRPANVAVDMAARQVHLSSIFGWYQHGFEEFARRRSSHPAPTLLDFIIAFASDDLADALVRARDERFSIVFQPYDWRVNAVGGELDAMPAKVEGIMLDGHDTLPDVEFTTLDGSTWRSKASRGKVVIIDFWATWCRPCLRSFPHYAELEFAYEKQGLEVVAIAEDDARAPVEAFAAAHHPAITIALDLEHRAAALPLGVSKLPTVLIVDRRGIVRHRHSGYRQPDVSGLRLKIEALLAEDAD